MFIKDQVNARIKKKLTTKDISHEYIPLCTLWRDIVHLRLYCSTLIKNQINVKIFKFFSGWKNEFPWIHLFIHFVTRYGLEEIHQISTIRSNLRLPYFTHESSIPSTSRNALRFMVGERHTRDLFIERSAQTRRNPLTDIDANEQLDTKIIYTWGEKGRHVTEYTVSLPCCWPVADDIMILFTSQSSGTILVSDCANRLREARTTCAPSSLLETYLYFEVHNHRGKRST